jgi:hypothetical protein
MGVWEYGSMGMWNGLQPMVNLLQLNPAYF